MNTYKTLKSVYFLLVFSFEIGFHYVDYLQIDLVLTW